MQPEGRKIPPVNFSLATSCRSKNRTANPILIMTKCGMLMTPPAIGNSPAHPARPLSEHHDSVVPNVETPVAQGGARLPRKKNPHRADLVNLMFGCPLERSPDETHPRLPRACAFLAQDKIQLRDLPRIGRPLALLPRLQPLHKSGCHNDAAAQSFEHGFEMCGHSTHRQPHSYNRTAARAALRLAANLRKTAGEGSDFRAFSGKSHEFSQVSNNI